MIKYVYYLYNIRCLHYFHYHFVELPKNESKKISFVFHKNAFSNINLKAANICSKL